MTSYRQLQSFPVPRCKAVSAPAVRDIVRHPPPQTFPLWRLKPDRALASNVGDVWPRECEPTPPYRELSNKSQGRMVAYRDGLLFLPNTTLATLADVGREMKEAAALYARHLGADFDIKAHFLSGADQEIAEALGLAAEFIEELLTGENQAARAQREKEIPASVRSSLAKKDAFVLPYAQLVEVGITEATPQTWWERVMENRIEFFYLVREDDAGKRSAHSFYVGRNDDHEGTPFRFTGKAAIYDSGKLSRTEATLTTLIGARAESDIAALWRDAERERLGEAFLKRLREQATNTGDPKMVSLQIAGEIAAERKRGGTTDATIAQIVLERLGAAADALARPPYAAHGIPDPIAKLRATAAGGSAQ
jgi:hypothetical protein